MAVPISCAMCPSFVAADAMPGKYGRSIGAPFCQRFGTVLGKPDFTDQQNRSLRESTATGCAEYGNPAPSEPSRDFYVMLPDPMLRDMSRISEPKKNACSSCGMCQNFVGEAAVVAETGWTSGLCAARGMLVLSNKQSVTARNCEYRQFGTPRTSIGGLNFDLRYEAGAGTSAVNPTRAYFNQKREGFIEPSEYPTDKPVSEGEATAGIRAWRKVEDPEGTGGA